MDAWLCCFERESLSLLHHTVPKAFTNCTSCFNLSSGFEPRFKQFVMEGVDTRQRWDASMPADRAGQLHRISVVSSTLRRVTVIYLLLARDGSRGGFNRFLRNPVLYWNLRRTQMPSHISNISTKSTVKQRVCIIWNLSLLPYENSIFFGEKNNRIIRRLF